MTGPQRLTGRIRVAQPALREFAEGYPALLQSWQDAISAWLQTHR